MPVEPLFTIAAAYSLCVCVCVRYRHCIMMKQEYTLLQRSFVTMKFVELQKVSGFYGRPPAEGTMMAAITKDYCYTIHKPSNTR